MGHRRGLRRLRSVFSAGIVVIGAVIAMASPAKASPAIVVTPATDLIEGQVVSVAASGFTPDVTVFVGTCPVGALGPSECDSRGFGMGTADATGSVVVTYAVHRFVRPRSSTELGPALDCALAGCQIGATTSPLAASFEPDTALTAVSFADVIAPLPTISVTPTTSVVDQDTVTVSGVGTLPNVHVRGVECPPGASSGAQCVTDAVNSVDGAGSFSIDMQVFRVIASGSGTLIDCGLVACTVGVQLDFGLVIVPLSFARPVISASVVPAATLTSGTGELVVRASASCDRTTPMTASATLSQGAVSHPSTVVRISCGQTPTQLFLTDYPRPADPPFQAGPVTVTITLLPFEPVLFGSFPSPTGDATVMAATLAVYDADAMRAAIVAMLADPANVELRHQIEDAIRTRAQQDPQFAAAFAAALRNAT